ncbi:MAG: hypothetical protein E7488_01935 [Ruminococcaceae bacterium]|nr:hypothetical protein [Oscillospiraceae bacterium]
MRTLKNILLSFLCTLFFPDFICRSVLAFSNSWLSALLMALLFLLFRHADGQNFPLRMKIFSLAPAFIFSALTAFGYRLEILENINFTDIRMLAAVLLYTCVFSAAICSVWNYLEENEENFALNSCSGFAAKADRVICWIVRHRIVMAAVMLLLWLPCYLSVFPGNFRYDAAAEFRQYTDGYSGDFPLLHSFITIRLLNFFYGITQSYNTGIAVYTIVQMVLLSLLFSQIIHTLDRQHINRFVLFVLLVYYSVFPAIHLLVTCNVRDVMFSGMLVWSVFLIYRMAMDYKKFMANIFNPFLLALVLVLTLLSRNNNTGAVMPAALAVVCLAVAFAAGRDSIRGSAVFAATAMGGYFLISAALTAACQPLVPAQTGSALSLFCQSLARSYYADGENWPQQDIEAFRRYFPAGDPYYVPENADSTKFVIQVPEDEKDEFMQFWLKKGREYPTVYLNAVLANTRQMWFPDVIVDGYNEAGKSAFREYEKCYFTFSDSIEKPGTLDSLLPQVHSFYENIGLFVSFEKVPVVSMLFSIGFHFWLLINCCFYVEYRKCRRLRLPLLILLGYCIISAFVPLVLLRYFAALFFAFPLITAFAIQPKSATDCQF